MHRNNKNPFNTENSIQRIIQDRLKQILPPVLIG
jgi:hypothetical protein